MMVYDAARQNIVLFGGLIITATPPGFTYTVTNETWTWDGNTWTQQHPATSPPPTFFGMMAYHSARQEAVLFGGIPPSGVTATQVVSDAWVWDGTTWSQRHPSVAPPARAAASMAYHEGAGLTVLFGGNNGASVFGDTWAWDGQRWQQLLPPEGGMTPTPQYNAAMAYYPPSRQVLLIADCGDSKLGCEGWALTIAGRLFFPIVYKSG